MANQRVAALEDKVRDAEKIIQSYAYGDDLDNAIAFLSEHDPKNAVLASIKDFDGNRAMLKTLNALYRADEARANNDTTELRQVAEFLEKSSYEAENMKNEADSILAALPVLEDEPEKVETIQDMMGEVARMQRAQEKHEYVQDHTPSMSDEEIVDNADIITSIFDELKWSEIIGMDSHVTVVDDNGKPLDVKETADLRGAHRSWVLLETTADRMDDAAFAAMSDDDKKEALKESVREHYEGDMIQMAMATANLEGKDEEEARKAVMSHRPIRVRASIFHANFDDKQVSIGSKINKFVRQGKEKAAKWMRTRFEKLNAITRKHTGYTPVEFGKMIVTSMSKRRFAANVATSFASLGATGGAMAMLAAGSLAATPAIAIAATGIAAFTAYNALAQQRWTIWEKKHAYWKAAKASGDEEEIAKWSGMAGWNNARNAIKANPEENEIYERIKKTNKRYALVSGLVMGAATALVPASSALLRGVGALGRGAAANSNAKFMYDLAKERYEANQTEENEISMKRARTGLWFGIGATAVTELGVLYSVAHSGIGAEHNPDNVISQEPKEAPVAEKPAIAPVAEVATTTKVEVPQEWNSDMHITQNQWNTLHNMGDFDSKWEHAVATQQANPEAFVHADGTQMSTEETIWVSDRIMSLAKAYPDGQGGYIAHMYDENHVEVFAKDGGWVYKDGTVVTSKDIAPECWGTEEEVAAFRALYKSIDCGDKVTGINSEHVDNLFDRAMHGNGDNYMDVDNCGKVHFIGFVKKIVEKILPKEEPVVVQEPEPPVIYEGPADNVPEVKPDAEVNEGGVIIKSAARPIPGSTSNGTGELDGEYIKSSSGGDKIVVEDSAVDAGHPVNDNPVPVAAKSTELKVDAGAGQTNGNGEQAFNISMMQKMRAGHGLG